MTEFGEPFTQADLGNWFPDRCDKADVTGKSAHGLRKALRAFGAELVLTDRGSMAIAGHAAAEETDRYTHNAHRAAMARSGMAKISGKLEPKSVPPSAGCKKVGQISRRDQQK